MSCSEHPVIPSISSWKHSRKISSFLIHQNKNHRWKHLEISWQNKIFSLLSFFFLLSRGCYFSFLLFIIFVCSRKYVTLKMVCRLYKMLVILYHMSPNSYEAGFVPESELESCNLFCSYQPVLEGCDKMHSLKTNVPSLYLLTRKNVRGDVSESVKTLL